jgi:hypothetical protein
MFGLFAPFPYNLLFFLVPPHLAPFPSRLSKLNPPPPTRMRVG